MNECARVWPVCPRPESDESLPSWFERVCHEYAMSPPLLLGVLEREAYGKTETPGTGDADRLHDSAVADRIAGLGQLSDSEMNALWPQPTQCELQDSGFCSYCPYCCLDDLRRDRTPYGRRCWQQSWCTICKAHGAALVVRKQTHVSSNRSLWSHAKLKSDREFLAPDRYRDRTGSKCVSDQVVRSVRIMRNSSDERVPQDHSPQGTTADMLQTLRRQMSDQKFVGPRHSHHTHQRCAKPEVRAHSDANNTGSPWSPGGSTGCTSRHPATVRSRASPLKQKIAPIGHTSRALSDQSSPNAADHRSSGA